MDVVRLPGRHWKWRMHAAAWTLVQRMSDDGLLDQAVDLFLVTDMLDVGQFRSALPPEHRDTPIALYFHENQLTFPAHPERPPGDWDRHYAFINVMSALLADAVWFNSEYHRTAFLEAIPPWLRSLPSPRPVQPDVAIRRKSRVLSIGLEEDVVGFEGRTDRFGDGPPVIAWNHRWEHDKGPLAFLELLRSVRDQGLAFRLCVLGQSFEASPDAFDVMRRELDAEVVHWGFAETRSTYLELLASSDIALVTAHHDFYGISVLESAALGLEVVAPCELAYPDHFAQEELVKREQLQDRLVEALNGRRIGAWKCAALKKSWAKVAPEWDKAAQEVLADKKMSGGGVTRAGF